MNVVTIYGVGAVTLMMVIYALEARSSRFIASIDTRRLLNQTTMLVDTAILGTDEAG